MNYGKEQKIKKWYINDSYDTILKGEIIYTSKYNNCKGILQQKHTNQLIVYYYELYNNKFELMFLNINTKEIETILLIYNLRIKSYFTYNDSNNKIFCLCGKNI